MADIAASDVTVTVEQKDRSLIGNKWRMNFVTIKFGNGVLTVPSGGGIPLPAVGYFGLNKTLLGLMIFGGKGPYEYSFDRTNHKLFVYHGDYSASSDGPHTNAGAIAIAEQTLLAVVIGT